MAQMSCVLSSDLKWVSSGSKMDMRLGVLLAQDILALNNMVRRKWEEDHSQPRTQLGGSDLLIGNATWLDEDCCCRYCKDRHHRVRNCPAAFLTMPLLSF